MAKKMLIDATHAEETRIVVADGNIVEEFDFETASRRQLAGNIYLAKVTRVEPSLQAAFVDYGGNRHGFLAFAEIHPDYYQIPAADREALKAEERAEDEARTAEENNASPSRRRRRRGGPANQADNGGDKDKADTDADADKATTAAESTGAVDAAEIAGMAVVDTGEGAAEPLTGANAQPDDQTGPSGQDTVQTDADDNDDSDDDGDDASDNDDNGEEIRHTRRQRTRRYKIQEVIRTRQIMLVQVVREERGNKGAALTTYLSLAGRYCVLMPNTARGGGISRKITSITDRKKLKDIASELEVPQGAGLIIRTAGSQRTKTEIRRDYEYLMRLWEQIRELTFKSVAPAQIYEEGDLIKRTIRDLYSKEIDEILVEGDRGYRTARDFMAMIMPSHADTVKHYRDPMPLFSRYQVENYLGSMFNPVVQLKSGGYIVIDVTEALVAIDVNSGRATKEGSIEETAYKTNCEAADEIVRQLRLRDLAGLIVIDFIDMDERKHNAAVEKRFKDRLKTDRARIQVGRISSFGLMEMSRQRMRPGMLESTTQPCAHCHGTGLIRSDDSLALTVLRAIEEEGTRKRSREVLVRAPVAVVNFLINIKREHVAAIETRFGMSVRIEADPTLISPDFAIEKFKTASRVVSDMAAPVVSADASLMAAIDDAQEDEPAAAKTDSPDTDAAAQDDEGRRPRRRRRRRRGGRSGEGENDNAAGNGANNSDQVSADARPADNAPAQTDGKAEGDGAAKGQEKPAGTAAAEAEKPAESRPASSRSRSRRGRSTKPAEDAAAPKVEVATDAVTDSAPKAEDAAGDKVPVQADAAQKADAPAAADSKPDTPPADAAPVTAAPETKAAKPVARAEAAEKPQPSETAAPPAPVNSEQPALAEVADTAPANADTAPAKPKRRGWWSAGE